MDHRIDQLAIHPYLRTWMGLRFGESCNSTDMLMTMSIAYVRYSWTCDLEAHHMEVVNNVVDIAKTTGRPQRVPTFKEFESYADQWDRTFCEPVRTLGAELIPPLVAKAIVSDIKRSERSAKLAGIEKQRAA